MQRRQHRDDGVGRLKFDFHTGNCHHACHDCELNACSRFWLEQNSAGKQGYRRTGRNEQFFYDGLVILALLCITILLRGPVWKSNFGRPTRRCPRNCCGSMAWSYNLTHWLIFHTARSCTTTRGTTRGTSMAPRARGWRT